MAYIITIITFNILSFVYITLFAPTLDFNPITGYATNIVVSLALKC